MSTLGALVIQKLQFYRSHITIPYSYYVKLINSEGIDDHVMMTIL